MSTPKRALAVIKTDLAQQWANTINRLMEETVAGTIAGFVTIGKAFMEARAQLGGKRGFNRLFQDHSEHVAHPLQCRRELAYRYIAIAESTLTVQHAAQLPDKMQTIYDIIKLPAVIRDAALKDGRIHPGMRRHDVRRLAGAVEHGVPRAWDLDAAMSAGRDKAALRVIHTDLAQPWATRINGHGANAVEAVLAMGRDLAAAKKTLHHGGWERMFAGHPEAVKEPVRFSVQSALKLMAIARHQLLSNPAHGRDLPSSWGTLYELTKLDDAILERALAEGRMHPDLQRRDIAALQGRSPVSHREDVGTVGDVVPRIRRDIQTLTVQHPRLVRVLPRRWISVGASG